MLSQPRLPFANRTATVVGHITHDWYDTIVPGGCAFYAAKTISALGGNVSLLTSVGNDFQCASSIANLNAHTVACPETTTFTNVYPADGPRIQYVTAQAKSLSPDQAPITFSNGDILILAPVMGEIDGLLWKNVRNARHVSLFLQGFMKQSASIGKDGKQLVIPNEIPFNFDILHDVDSVFLSEEDIELFASSAFLDQLIQRVPTVSVTQGERGSRIYTGNGVFDFGVFPTEAVDPTGAGDTYAAATAMSLACGFSVEDAGKLGAAAASIIVEGRGGEKLCEVSSALLRQPGISCNVAEKSWPIASY